LMCLAIIAGVANQSESNSHISYCVPAKSHMWCTFIWAHMMNRLHFLLS